jgi:hypothetical protein
MKIDVEKIKKEVKFQEEFIEERGYKLIDVLGWDMNKEEATAYEAGYITAMNEILQGLFK